MLILIGEKDYNDASRCADRVAERRQAGAQVYLVTYPGAHHGFLASVPPRMVETPVYRDCMPLTIDKANGVLEMKFGSTADMPVKELIGKTFKSGCIEPRGMVGGNSAATADALRRTITFSRPTSVPSSTSATMLPSPSDGPGPPTTSLPPSNAPVFGARKTYGMIKIEA